MKAGLKLQIVLLQYIFLKKELECKRGNHTTTFNERLNFHLLNIDWAERAIIYYIGMMWPISVVLELGWILFLTGSVLFSVLRSLQAKVWRRGRMCGCAQFHIIKRGGRPPHPNSSCSFIPHLHPHIEGFCHRSVVPLIPPTHQWQSNSIQWILSDAASAKWQDTWRPRITQ